MKSRIGLYSIFCVIMVLLLSVGYSAFEREMVASNILADVRIQKDVRVVGIRVVPEKSSLDINSVQDYNIGSISGTVDLVNEDSYVTYEVRVVNLGASEVGIYEIQNIPDNLELSLENYQLQDMICDDQNECNLGIYKTFYLKLKYKSGSYDINKLTQSFNLKFDFRIFHNIDYIGIVSNNYPKKIIDGGRLSIVLNDVAKAYLKIKTTTEQLSIDTDYSYNDETGQLIVYDIKDHLTVINDKTLPSEYYLLDYITSNGNQYIDTGVLAKSGLKSDITLSFENLVGNDDDDYGILGARKSVSNSAYERIYLLHYYNGFALGYGNYYSSTYRLANNKKYEVHTELNSSNQFISIDNSNVVSTNIENSYNIGLNLYLFAINQNGSPHYSSSINLYHCKIYDGNTLIREFVPVIRQSDGEIGLYDLVNDVFYENQGTEPFGMSYPGYQRVEFIKSDGNQYIDTGVNAKTGLKSDIVFSINNIDSGANDFGILGARKTVSGSFNRIYLLHYFNGFTLGYGNYYSSGVLATQDAKYVSHTELNSGNQFINIDGEEAISRTLTGSYNLGLNLYLFAINENNNATYNSSITFYECKIYDGNNLVRYYIPVVRKDDGEVGLFDIINRQFYQNLGTGNFVSGGILE